MILPGAVPFQKAKSGRFNVLYGVPEREFAECQEQQPFHIHS